MGSVGRYAIEYAKSSRSKCQQCNKNIEQGTVRVGKYVHSQSFDGVIPLWHHVDCIFDNETIGDVALVDNVDRLRPADQKMFKDQIAKHNKNATPASVAATVATAAAAVVPETKDKESKAAGSGKRKRAADDSEPEQTDTSQQDWQSMNVAALKRECQVRGLATSGRKADLVTRLSELKDSAPKNAEETKASPDTSDANLPAPSVSSASAAETSEEQIHQGAIEEETKRFWAVKDSLDGDHAASTAALKEMLSLNNQSNSGGRDSLLQRCAEGLLYGSLPACPECKEHRLMMRDGQYACTARTEWSKCTYTTDHLVRGKWKLPESLSQFCLPAVCRNATLTSATLIEPPLAAHRFIAQRAKALSQKTDAENDQFAAMRKSLRDTNKSLATLFKGLAFCLLGKLQPSSDAVRDLICECGGTVTNVVAEAKVAMMARPTYEHITEASAAMQAKLKEVVKRDLPLLCDTFVHQLSNAASSTTSLATYVGEHLLNVTVASRVLSSLVQTLEANKQASSATSAGTEEKKVRLKVKDGCVVHTESQMSEFGHVFREGADVYDAVLNLTDISSGLNSYYMIQVIEKDSKDTWYVSRKWGRVGTSSGGHKLEEFKSSSAACRQFQALFLEKTGNNWDDRRAFVKQTNKFYPLDVDYGGDSSDGDSSSLTMVPSTNASSSRLDPRIQDLIRIIFDVKQMQQAMLEMEIDIQKMPLGKLSRARLHRGFEVLNELQTLISSGSTTAATEGALISATNRFHTYIPQSFGHKSPPIIRDTEMLRAKIQLIEMLLEIEAATQLMSSSGDGDLSDPLTVNYRKLKTNIVPLQRDGSEWQMITRYVKNTHGNTHRQYGLEVLDVFAVDREGEADVFKESAKLHNRQLLWHGSRTTNFVGILSQGLRIAPKEAPATGYMFGKGIYTADMVSKSANYVFASRDNPIGFLLLCDVALGDMYPTGYSQYMDEPIDGYHSTKGIGRTIPDPSYTVKLANGCTVPLGPGVDSGVRDTSLLYNEYIVYRTSQVQIKYLVKLKFNYTW